MTGVLIRRGCTDTQRQHHMNTEAEMGIMLPQAKDAKDCWETWKPGRFFLASLRGGV